MKEVILKVIIRVIRMVLLSKKKLSRIKALPLEMIHTTRVMLVMETVVMTFGMMIKFQTHCHLMTMKKSMSVDNRLQIHLVVKNFCIWGKRTDVRLISK